MSGTPGTTACAREERKQPNIKRPIQRTPYMGRELTVKLSTPVALGAERKLTQKECDFIRNQKTSVQPYVGKNWTLVRSASGSLGLWWRAADGQGGHWHLVEVACDGPQYEPVLTPGSGAFAAGSADDRVHFDYAIDKLRKVVYLGSLLVSKTGDFTQDFEGVVAVSYASDVVVPYTAAASLVDRALDWCRESGVVHDIEKWQQDPAFFARAVHSAVTAGEPAVRVAQHMVRRPLNGRACA